MRVLEGGSDARGSQGGPSDEDKHSSQKEDDHAAHGRLPDHVPQMARRFCHRM